SKINQARAPVFQAPEAAAGTDNYAFEENAYDQAGAASTPTATAASTTAASSTTAPGSASSAASTATTAASGSSTFVAPTPPQPVTYNYRVEQAPAATLANVASTTLPGDSSAVGRPAQHVPPRSTAGSNANSSTRNSISLPGGGREGSDDEDNSDIPQNDGAADAGMDFETMTREEMDMYLEKRYEEAQKVGEMSFTLTLSDRAARKARREGVLEELTMGGQLDGEEDEDDDTGLGSDLDDSDGDMDEESDNIVLCQYDKVSRTKSKWKCVLKDGIMLINGRDYLFHKANGDFEW
ncbi:transcription factor IIA subunit alpha, partial [Lunasporangiospora selenospora]